jgi:hypothetical protein
MTIRDDTRVVDGGVYGTKTGRGQAINMN